MLDLALHGDAGPVALSDIAGRQNISLPYLEQLFARLRRGRLVESVRGPGGGYVLARDPELLSVAEIIDSVDEGLDATRCGGRGDCDHGAVCLTHDLWSDLSGQIHDFLNGITLAGLVARRPVRKVAERQRQRNLDQRIPAQAV